MLTEKVEEIMRIALAECAKGFNINESDIIGRSRRRGLTVPRHALMYVFATTLTDAFEFITLSDIGAFFGARDHTTVLHARESMRDILRFAIKNPKFSSAREKAICATIELVQKIVLEHVEGLPPKRKDMWPNLSVIVTPRRMQSRIAAIEDEVSTLRADMAKLAKAIKTK